MTNEKKKRKGEERIRIHGFVALLSLTRAKGFFVLALGRDHDTSTRISAHRMVQSGRNEDKGITLLCFILFYLLSYRGFVKFMMSLRLIL